jgi:hypothetical protein
MVIVKDFRGFHKTNLMLPFVLPRFLGIPFEYQHDGSDGNLTFPVSGGALPYVPWHFILHRPLQPVVSRHRDASDHGGPSALAGSW